MKARLMFDDHDFDPEHAEAPGDADLIQDLDLATLWATAAGDDKIVHAAVRTATLEPLTDPADIDYRADVFADCLAQPIIIHRLYELACRAVDQERQIYRASFYSHSSEALLNRSITALRMFVVVLKELRNVADQCETGFSSTGLRRFFATLETELTDSYFAEIDDHLRILRFHDGLVATARLGRQSQGTDYVLRTPRQRNQKRLRPRHPPVRHPYYNRTIPRADESGQQDLAKLRDRIVALAADSLAQAAAHILSFFTALRAGLAFYIGCLNLHHHLTVKGLYLCRPHPHALTTRIWTARDLYDPCLALRTAEAIHGNDLDADNKPLVMITGANQGGKSTFLRSLGLAQLMMQAGMPAPATAFAASTTSAVITHYAREEDATMLSGKFDEELHRMRLIANRVRPHSLLLCNESFAATNEREAADIATDVLRAFSNVNITVAFVTHLYELAHRFEQEHAATTLFLRADRERDGKRSFDIRPGAPRATSYGQDLYRHTFHAS